MTTTTRTTCPYCGVGCGVLATPQPDGSVAIAGDPEHPANFGRLCSKGAALGETLSLQGRLLHPEIRGQRASWNEALDLGNSDTLRTGARDRVTDGEIDRVELEIRRQVLTLWQTAIIRSERPRIEDEIMGGLQYHEATLMDVIPPLNAEIAERLDCGDRPVVRPGSWIGGDRDGNPYVTGDVVRFATEQAAELLTELGHHVEEAEPPIEGMAVAPEVDAMLMMSPEP